MKKELANKIIIENKTNFVNHPYFLVLDIWDAVGQFGKPMRLTRIVNIYKNYIGQKYIREEETLCNHKILEDIV